jgi:RluA family pseudouridine synthase
MLEKNIIFEDDSIVVLNKPPGVVVNRAETVKDKTVQDFMEETGRLSEVGETSPPVKLGCALPSSPIRSRTGSNRRGDQVVDELLVFRNRSGIVHRLDKDTSGVLVVAKNVSVMFELMRQFKDREVEKKYVALVHGILDPREGVWSLPLGRERRGRWRFEVSLDGKMSETRYVVQETWKLLSGKYQDGFSLVELIPKTGRTHQLRVVLKHINHPMVGDGVYVGRKRGKLDASWCPRQFLHAKYLKITHPVTGSEMVFEAALPEDLEKALEYVKKLGARS